MEALTLGIYYKFRNYHYASIWGYALF